MNILTASGDHTCCLWDVAESVIKPISCFQGHTRSVKTIAKPPEERCKYLNQIKLKTFHFKWPDYILETGVSNTS